VPKSYEPIFFIAEKTTLVTSKESLINQ